MTETTTIEDAQLGLDDSWTRREIIQQPETLRATHALLRREQAAIDAFIAPLLARCDRRIVLAGAGTSAFIGESLAPWLSRTLQRRVDAVATTDIVSTPTLHFRRDEPVLLVSFGRSGNSPESSAAINLADANFADVNHLIITCNKDGGLAQRQEANTHIVVLPEATHDRGFAMTSSYSAMMFAALAIFSGIDSMDERCAAIARTVTSVIEQADAPIAALAASNFERVVYLGSGVFKGLAREAALKLMELSDGALVTTYDTTMGFRHGPKTIVNARTLVVVFVSNELPTARYDRDIIDELRADGHAGAVIAISAQPILGEAIGITAMANAADVDLLFPYIVPAQLFGLHSATVLGLTPDRPNASGAVNRVVQGVRIHPSGA
jgi:tagatose-6-phosphate ketose/aldose isomerase